MSDTLRPRLWPIHALVLLLNACPKQQLSLRHMQPSTLKTVSQDDGKRDSCTWRSLITVLGGQTGRQLQQRAYLSIGTLWPVVPVPTVTIPREEHESLDSSPPTLQCPILKQMDVQHNNPDTPGATAQHSQWQCSTSNVRDE